MDSTTQMTRLKFNTVEALLKFRIISDISKLFATNSLTITLALVISAVCSNAYAQEAKATLDAPNESSVGESITVDWSGPGEKGDVIAVAEAGEKKTINKTPVTRGTPLTIQMPATPGEYELRYILRQGRTVLATRPITVTAPEVTLDAPEQASVGSSVSINWEGPDIQGDVVAVAKIGEKKTINKTLTVRGNPLSLLMPAEPGEYELRYILRQGRTVLATRPITVEKTEVTLDATGVASVGEPVSVKWEGPDIQGDVVAIAKVGEKKTINRTLTARGNPLSVLMPTETGEYELRYILRQGRTVLATRPITVNKADVTLDAPDIASVGEPVSINWVGPGVQGDMVAIAKIGEKKAISRTLTASGNPLIVKMPVEPGEYELRYILRQGRTVLTTQPITVKKAEIELDAPDVASVGESVSVTWVGRQVKGDVIALAKIGDKNRINPVFTPRDGPLTVKMPKEPGEYELRYMLYKNYTVLATRPITVKNIEAVVNAPDQAITGESIVVDWAGPDAERDVIAVAKVGVEKPINSVRTSRGKPLGLRMPTKPGEYELRYILHDGRITLATQPITVNKMSLNAPDEATIGETVPVSWDGPGGKSGSIYVVEAGKRKASVYGSAKGGSPFKMRMPATPGEYEIRYIHRAGGGTALLASRTITIKAATVVLDAPSEASVGESFSITWQGPDKRDDTIEIGKPGDTKRITGNYTYRGSPLRVLLPTEPGEYEIRYVLRQKSTVLATRPLKVNAAEITLDAPGEANAGESVSINWTGPAAEGDVIGVAEVGQEDRIFGAATSRGSPLTVKMPETPGEYEFRYILRQGNTVLATRPVTVKETQGIMNVPLNTSAFADWSKAMIAVALIFLILPI